MKLTGKITDNGLKAVSQKRHIKRGHKIPRIWILLADRRHVRIFSKTDGHLEEIGSAVPQSHVGNVPNHTQGRVVSSASGVLHHKLPPRSTVEEKESLSFAQDIATWLDEAVREDAFDRLVLAAAPHVLGDLRKTLNKTVHARVVAEVDKDLIKMKEKDIYEELEKIVWF